MISGSEDACKRGWKTKVLQQKEVQDKAAVDDARKRERGSGILTRDQTGTHLIKRCKSL